MDWFKRYGIPGVYFISLTFAWIHAFYRCWLLQELEPEALIQLGLFLFLPVGYIISILGQLRYLGSGKGGLGIRAAERICISEALNCRKREPNLEALACLNAAFSDNNDFKAHKFIQEWIRKRMDVVVINRSILIATVLSPCVALAVGLVFRGMPFQQLFWWLIILLVVVSAVISFIMWASNKTLEEQITIVISGAWKKMGFIPIEGIVKENNPYRLLCIFLPDEWPARVKEWWAQRSSKE